MQVDMPSILSDAKQEKGLKANGVASDDQVLRLT